MMTDEAIGSYRIFALNGYRKINYIIIELNNIEYTILFFNITANFEGRRE